MRNEKKLTLHCFETKKNLKKDAKTSNDQKIWKKEIEKNKNLAKMKLLEIKVQRNMYYSINNKRLFFCRCYSHKTKIMNLSNQL